MTNRIIISLLIFGFNSVYSNEIEILLMPLYSRMCAGSN